MNTQSVNGRWGPHGLRLSAAALALLFAVALAAACGGSQDEESAAEQTSDSLPGQPKPGPMTGDVADVKPFTDPAAQIVDSTELTAYVLPGMSGAGVKCARAQLEPDEILDMSFSEGADAVATILTDCTDADSIGRVVAMYATGFEADHGVQYGELEACAAEELVPPTPPEPGEVRRAHRLLTPILEARLDLLGPLTSPGIAYDTIADETTCLEVVAHDPTTTTTTAVPDPTTTAAPDTTTGSTLPPGARQTTWTFVNAGACVLALPGGNASMTTLIPCGSPHGGEVVSAGLGAAPGPDQCQTAVSSYVGEGGLPFQADIVTVTRSELSNTTRTICIVGPSDGSKVTGSVKG